VPLPARYGAPGANDVDERIRMVVGVLPSQATLAPAWRRYAVRSEPFNAPETRNQGPATVPRVGAVIVVALRLAVPLVILRRPLLGGVLSFVADTADLVAFDGAARRGS
jgi:hypothetical protein